MSSMVHMVLSTELTSIPNSMQKILANNFDNGLCNGVTWLFASWLIVHFCYDKLLHVYLKQLGFTQYLRTRLSSSLWLLVFFVLFLVYFTSTINEYNILDLMNFGRIIVAQSGSVPTQRILVHAVLCSFYLHMGCNQGMQLGSLHSLSKCLALIVICTSAYILRLLDISFTLAALMAISGVFEELSKMFYSLLNRKNKFNNLFINFLYVSSVILFCAVYFVIIPLSFLIPLGMMLFSGNANLLTITLFTSLLFWLNLVIYKSMVLNLLFHWVYHLRETHEDVGEEKKQTMQLGCLGNIIECSLFPPRTDDGYMIAFLKFEARKRQKRMIAKRKPKNRNMIIQTLKCMMIIKRKLSEQKVDYLNREDSDDSDEQEEQDHFIHDGNSDGTDKVKQNEVKESGKIVTFSALIGHENVEANSDKSETEIASITEEEIIINKSSKSILNTINDSDSREELSNAIDQDKLNNDQKEDINMKEHGCSSNKTEDKLNITPVPSKPINTNKFETLDASLKQEKENVGKKSKGQCVNKKLCPKTVESEEKLINVVEYDDSNPKLANNSEGSGNGKTAKHD